MDKWYSRKIEVRDVLVSCLVAGGLSATLSWLIFAWADGTEKFPWGSLGDWAAAIGTWVIGYGAWKYAAATFVLQSQQLEQADERSRRLRSAQLRGTETWAGLLIRPLFHINETLRGADKNGAVSLGTLCGAIAGTRNLVAVVKWDDPAWDVLGDDGVEAKISALTVARNFDLLCAEFLKCHYGKERMAVVNEIGGLRGVLTGCMELDKAGRAIAALAARAKAEFER
ncbi:hypothetical protein [Stenotrophomonas forensis]|uniref:Uncharacterized protein n=1 Tax=Stenotrophomonas forensis TaxID=2871169 RepID=A0ABY7XWF4_9GAMM|nr:hypothetical protein [Stenotrophomonas sp. DFS-20110405]WDM61802.1 hypothetical protein K5L94_11595 [Stenotrophomonas sp. DFS-20110405]